MQNIEVLINDASRQNVKDDALAFVKKADAYTRYISFPVNKANIDPKANTFVIVGGDGTQKGFMEYVLTRDDSDEINMLIAPGGNENGPYRGLVATGAVVTAEEILDGDFSKLHKYHPGDVNGKLFNQVVGFGKHGLNLAKYIDQQRGIIPRDLNSVMAGTREVVRSLIRDEFTGNIVRLAFVGTGMGRVQLFPDRNIFAKDLGIVSLDAEGKKEAALKVWSIAMCIKNGISIPENVATWQRKEVAQFNLSPSEMVINTDGQIEYLESQIAVASRNRKSINIAAINLQAA